MRPLGRFLIGCGIALAFMLFVGVVASFLVWLILFVAGA